MPPPHPFFVHFPIGILVLALVFDAVGALARRPELSRFAWWAQIAGTIGLAATVLTGLLAGSTTIVPEAARSTFDTHEQLAFLTTSLFSVLFLWRIGSKGNIPPTALRLYIILFALSVVLVLITAWFGGELVYGFGTGIHRPLP